MNKNENGFSLVVVVIFMSIAALFIGYLMGSWLISFLVEEDTAEIAEQEQTPAQVSQQVAENSQEEVEEINNTKNNLTAPPEDGVTAPVEENNTAAENTAVVEQDDTEQNEAEQDQSQNTEEADNDTSEGAENTGGFGVQIGAFSNYNNALTVRDTVSELGFEVVITDSSPHQVQVVGYESRDQAESAAEELETEGYPGFIVIRE